MSDPLQLLHSITLLSLYIHTSILYYIYNQLSLSIHNLFSTISTSFAVSVLQHHHNFHQKTKFERPKQILSPSSILTSSSSPLTITVTKVQNNNFTPYHPSNPHIASPSVTHHPTISNYSQKNI